MGTKTKLLAVIGLLAVAAMGALNLATPAFAACEPVVCPAIAKICPDGQLACRVSPCNCTLVCRPSCNP